MNEKLDYSSVLSAASMQGEQSVISVHATDELVTQCRGMHQDIPFMTVPESTTLAAITIISHLLSMGLCASSHTVFATAPISHSAIEKETEDQAAHVRKAVRYVSCLPLKAADHLASHASSNPFSLLFFLFLP